MKSIVTFVALLFVLVFVPAAVYADDPIQLFLDGKQLKPEVAPILVNDNTLVPVRIIAENLGAKVQWDGEQHKVIVQKEQVHIEMTIDEPQVKVNDEIKTLEVPPKLINGNTLVPVRFVSEQMGVKVAWDGLTNSVFLFREDKESQLQGNSNPPADKPNADKPSGEAAKPDSGTDAAAGDQGKSAAPGTAGSAQDAAAGKTSPANPGTPVPAQDSAKPADAAGAAKPAPITKDDEKIPNIQSVQLVGDRLYIQATGNVKTNLSYLGNPDRLVIDIPNSELDAKINGQPAYQNGEIPVNSPLASKIRYALYSDQPSTVRIVLDLKAKVEASAVPTNVPNQIVLQLKTPKYKVVIDAGHGGHDSGAVSITGRYEKDFTLSMVKKVKALLDQEKDIQAYLTRSDDTFVELDDRVAFANDRNADLFVSIHGNKYTPETQGTETYYYRDESLPFANLIHSYVVKATGFPDRKVRQEQFRVISKTTMPAVLLEIGYLSNADEEAAMYSDDFQNRVAASIVAAIKDYLHIQ